ncbi:MerR family transcriptional regulator [Nonomuraea sp. NPDC050663]|uniref:MerR family transcriptional regulator n=1 Tax=Nonomuraea sp. NPDC050663 TaxID=3364370 RepID=UPI0037B8A49B
MEAEVANRGERVRVSELARRAGVSVQQVRNYADQGLLPPVERAGNGYRVFTGEHERALRTVRSMAAGHGWQCTGEVMRAVHAGRLEDALALVDASHAELSRERADLARVLGAFEELAAPAGRSDAGAPEVLAGLTSARVETARAGAGRADAGLVGAGRAGAGRVGAAGVMRVGEVAGLVGVRASALRVWESMGWLRPSRDRVTGYRVYDAHEVRKAQAVALLRRAHYPLPAVEAVMRELDSAGSPQRLRRELARRGEDLHRLSLLRLAGSAALYDYLRA